LQIADVIRERGPLTVAAFMDVALYDDDLGYYARAAQRSGRAGDFFTSVDVGALFGAPPPSIPLRAHTAAPGRRERHRACRPAHDACWRSWQS
jgi:hypothetical protein